jgi:Staphylococcus phage HNH endonuclease
MCGYTKHGMTKSPEYRAFWDAKMRCKDRKHPRWNDYGGRRDAACPTGVKFLFENFTVFMLDIGPKPSPELELDRINNDGNYEPGNVRWATVKEQNRNRRCGPGRRR